MWLRNSILAGMAALAALFLCAAPALAGDRALAMVIGYSNDGRYFAFEEFGVQDGSGFAYSNIYMVDLDNDRWVVGTPIRLQAEDESTDLGDIRREAHAEARLRLDELGVERPAQVAALIGDGEPDNDGLSLSFGIPVGYLEPGTVGSTYNLSLEIFYTESGAPCIDWFGERPMGFAIRITDVGGTREAYRDRSLPRSRGCPITYRFYGVFLPHMATDISRAVALVSVYVYGFEGPDRRFLAVPLAY